MLDEINAMKKGVNSFSVYQPAFELHVPDLQDETKKIKEDLKLKLERYLRPIDNTFARENFEYATKEMGNEQIRHIYELLGPFDYSKWKDEALE
jgi:hypothetical protein